MTTINILSTGQTASRLSLRVGDLRTVASELSIEPAAIINSVVYYSEADVQRMAERVERERTPEKQ